MALQRTATDWLSLDSQLMKEAGRISTPIEIRPALLERPSRSVGPAHKHRTCGVARSHSRKHHQFPLLEPPVVKRVSDRKRDGSGGRVPELMNVLDYLVLFESQPVGRRVHDT